MNPGGSVKERLRYQRRLYHPGFLQDQGSDVPPWLLLRC